MAKRLSVQEILEAARSPDGPSSSAKPSAPSEKKEKPKAKPVAKVKVESAEAIGAKPAGAPQTVKEKIAAARAASAGGTVTPPKIPAKTIESSVASVETKPTAATVPKSPKPKTSVATAPEPAPEPVGRPAPLLAILLAGWVGFATFLIAFYAFYGSTLTEVAAKPAVLKSPEASAKAP